MSIDTKNAMPSVGKLKLGACALALLLTVGLGSANAAFAQDATPAASPVAMACDAPALPPGTPTPQEEATPGAEASPMAEMDMGTPMADAGATEATPVPAVGTAAEGADADAIIAAVTNLGGCLSNGEFDKAAALVTTNFLLNFVGTDNPYDFAAGVEGASFNDFQFMNPMTYDDGSVSADVQYMTTEYQLASERWTLVKDGDLWKLDSFALIAPATDLDTAAIGVNLTEATDDAGKTTYAIAPNETDHAEVPALIFHTINKGTEAHELTILQLPEGATFDDVMSGKVGQNDVKFIGNVAPILPGAEADLTLINLPAGKYTMVCFFSGPDGAPHAFNGMHADFEVTAAS